MADNLSPLSTVQSARAALRFGNRVSLDAEVSVTPLGLLAIGALVSAILPSVPPIVRAAGKAARARRKAGRAGGAEASDQPSGRMRPGRDRRADPAPG